MAGIEQVLSNVLEGRPTAHFDRMNAVWESWFDLYAALLLNDIAETEWEALASIVEKKATSWHANFMMVAHLMMLTPPCTRLYAILETSSEGMDPSVPSAVRELRPDINPSRGYASTIHPEGGQDLQRQLQTTRISCRWLGGVV